MLSLCLRSPIDRSDLRHLVESMSAIACWGHYLVVSSQRSLRVTQRDRVPGRSGAVSLESSVAGWVAVTATE